MEISKHNKSILIVFGLLMLFIAIFEYNNNLRIDKLMNKKESTNIDSQIAINTQEKEDIIVDAIAKKTYPVGTIYISTTEDTVAKVEAKFGGEWAVYSQGKTLVGNDETNYITGDATKGSGGSSTISLAADQIPSIVFSGTTDSTGSGYTIGRTSTSRSATHTGTCSVTAWNTSDSFSGGSHTHTIYSVNGLSGSSNTHARLQSDGNFVIYKSASSWTALWASGTSGNKSGVGTRVTDIGIDGTTVSAGDHAHTATDYYTSGISGVAAHTHSYSDKDVSKITGVQTHTHTFTGNYTNNSLASINVENPYTVVYMYERVS